VKQNTPHDANSVEAFTSWLFTWMADEMGIERSQIDPIQTFLSYGMDSVQAMTMVGDLEAKLGMRLPPTLAWDYPDINALAAHLAARCSETPAAPARTAVSSATVDHLLDGLDKMRDRDAERPMSTYVESAQKQ
jgi:acyl carrier protein